MTNTDMELRTNGGTHVEFRAGRGGRAGRLLGRTIPYNVRSMDLGGFVEIWLPGSLSKVLRDRQDDVVADFNHSPDNILGRVSAGTLQLKDGPKGLDYVISPVPDTSMGNDVVENVRLGNITGNSFTFAVASGGDTWTKDGNGLPLRTVHEASRLFSVGPVVSPAFPDGTTISARSLALAERVSRDMSAETKWVRQQQALMEARHGVGVFEDEEDDY